MRISTAQMFIQAQQTMLQGQARVADIQSKLSSGKNNTTLADDPVAANQIVTLKRELAQLDMFGTNIDSTRRRLAIEDTTLASLNDAMDRMLELTIQSANGTLSDNERLGVAYELEELVEYSASLMNTRDAKGEYIFSGSKGNTQTYQLNGDGRYVYGGDDTQRTIQVASTQYVESTDTGKFLFESVSGALSLDVINSSGAGVTLSSINVSDERAFQDFMHTTGDLKFSAVGGSVALTNTVTGATVPEQLLSRPDVSLSGSSPNFTFSVPGASIDIQADTTVGASASLRLAQEPSSILNSALDLADALRSLSTSIPAESAQIASQQHKMLDDLSEAQINMSTSRASIGARLNAIEKAEYSNSDFKFLTEITLSAVEDLDYAAASADLARFQLALESSYASFGVIQQTSLFEYL